MLESLGFVLGKEGVYLGELAKRPVIRRRGDVLVVEIGHSRRNSAKEVYRLEAELDANRCVIRGFQKLVTRTFGQDYRQEIPLPQSRPVDSFYWADPDKTLHVLQVSEGGPALAE